MARPKTISDEAILRAAIAVMGEKGPDGLTFLQVARAVGLSAATLVQRYGTKAAMVQAALLHAWDDLDARTAEADATAPLTPQGAIAMLVSLSGSAPEIEDYGNGLLLLREDMRDPALRARGAAWGRALAKALGRRLSDDPMRQTSLGRLMASQWQGAQLWWAFSRESAAHEAIADELRLWCAVVLAEEKR